MTVDSGPRRGATLATGRLVGRAPELSRLDALLRARDTGAALALVGEAGIGKSALLAAVVEAARDRTVLQATGVESESCIPFSTLHQLLLPVLRAVPGLAPEHRRNLDVALGPADAGSAADVFQTALAALELLSELAPPRPVLVVVEDAHWADPASATVLSFVARRLANEPVVLLVAMRPDAGEETALRGLPTLRLGPLGAPDAAALLDSTGLRDERLRQPVLREAAGNPLALLELPLAVARGGWEPSGPPMPITERLERAFSRRLDGLPAASRAALLVAAAHDCDDVAESLGALRYLPGGDAIAVPELLAPVLERDLLVLSAGRLRFGHPLVRSAVYQSATPLERSAAHRALAMALVGQLDRRAWHLAAAAIGPDERAADEIAEVAGRARARGAAPVVAYALQRAAELTPGGPLRAERLLRAAEVALDLGDPIRAGTLLEQAAPLVEGATGQGRAALLEEGVRPPAAGELRIGFLVTLATRVAAEGDLDLAVRLLQAAAVRVWSTECGPAARRTIVAAVLALPLPVSDHRLLAVLGLADPQGYEGAIEDGLRALGRAPVDGSSLGLITSPYLVEANLDLAGLQSAELDRLRRQGLLRMVPMLIAHHAWTELCLARWSTAAVLADEGVRISEELGQPLWAASNLITQAMIAAVTGDHDTSTSLSERAERVLLPLRIGASLNGIQLTRAVNENAAGRYDDAFEQALRVYDVADPAHHHVHCGWLLAELAGAALHCGRQAEARAIVARYERPDGAPTTPWSRMGVEFARPLLAGDDTAEALFEAALAGRVAAWPAYRARLLLEYGVWLRRQRRTAESRHPLRAAREACDALGLVPWAERARAELRASGEGSGPARPRVWKQLSPQELQIARLAAKGLSNREIGLQLFLSHRTIGSHLYRIFPKLGISARSQLRDVLEGSGPAVG